MSAPDTPTLIAALSRVLPADCLITDSGLLRAYECDGLMLIREQPLAVALPTTEQQVIEHCGRYLAKYKIPKQVVITDRIERTASGKSQKHLLLERWRAQFSTARA